MSPAEVAAETLRALPRGGAPIPGAFNRVLSQLPRTAAVCVLAKQRRSSLRRATAGDVRARVAARCDVAHVVARARVAAASQV